MGIMYSDEQKGVNLSVLHKEKYSKILVNKSWCS